MNTRRRQWVFIAMLGFAVPSIALLAVRIADARAGERQARESLPAIPDLTGTAPELLHRLEKAYATLGARPSDAEALGELARLYAANGFRDEAESALRAVIAQEPHTPQWPHLLAGLLAGYGRLDSAVEWWRKAHALAPAYTPIPLKLGDALLKTNRAQEARKAFADVLQREPSSARARVGLARCDIEEGRWSAARLQLEAAIQAEPSFSAPYSLLATVAERLGDARTAETVRAKAGSLGRYRDVPDPWSEALTLDCYDVYRLHVIAATLSATGDNKEALVPLERALALFPEDARTYRQLGRVYFKVGDMQRARRHLEKAVQLEPAESSTYLDLVALFRATRERDQAVRVLAEGLAYDPGNAALNFEMASARVAEGALEQAIDHFQRACRSEPDNPGAYQELAAVYFRMDRRGEAVDVLNAALERNPRHIPILLMAARFWIEEGELDQARAHLNKAEQAGAAGRSYDELRRQFRRRFGNDPS